PPFVAAIMKAAAPVAQSDRAPASEAGCTGSSPVGGASFQVRVALNTARDRKYWEACGLISELFVLIFFRVVRGGTPGHAKRQPWGRTMNSAAEFGDALVTDR